MWQTITPEGATLMLRQVGGNWIADYLGRRTEASTADSAIRGVLQVGTPAADAALERWIAAHAAELDAVPPAS
jgi:hypothetical protein